MNKELTHRSHELKALGWSQEDLSRYEDLWDYSQRWGLINLEREDRQFLKKAEKLLPKIQNKKASIKKSIEEKSYYLWLNFYLEEIQIFNESYLPEKQVSVWTLMIEEELKLLKELQPVMGLTDTLKAKNLFTIRKQLIQKAYNKYGAKNNKEPFDFSEILNKSEKDLSKSWKSITEKDTEANQTFPIIDSKKIDAFRTDINKDLKSFMRENYPSLKEDL
ncbi:conserved hypothetical protein [Prochlorococcus marinus str. MIT 9515]|uniref:Uncharacterized protein n=1 Tax=Prochlorococcus marinus (strain MIT 9515) TaxID=167542 RepID=A2BVV5_PROM5|nr:hypothetical protein [Prochlorococcus marinus]ABM71916.1 conserved hypothetical protein [Prochlorococcus marinus str. MIT 9515]